MSPLLLISWSPRRRPLLWQLEYDCDEFGCGLRAVLIDFARLLFLFFFFGFYVGSGFGVGGKCLWLMAFLYEGLVFFFIFYFMCTGFLAGDLAYFTRYVCSVL